MNIYDAIEKGIFDMEEIEYCAKYAEPNYLEVELKKRQLILDKAEKQGFDLSDFKGHQANGDRVYYFRNLKTKSEFWADFGYLPKLSEIDTKKINVSFGYMDYVNRVFKFSKKYTIKYCIEHTVKIPNK